MAIAGPWAGWLVWRLATRIGAPPAVTVFVGAPIAALATYVVTSLQLALAFPDPVSGLAGSFLKFAGIFALTQIPLAIAEGLLTVVVMGALIGHDRPTGSGHASILGGR